MGKNRKKYGHGRTYSTAKRYASPSRAEASAATPGEWEALYEDGALLRDFRTLADELTKSQKLAQRKSLALRRPVEEVLDIGQAKRMLEQNPLLVRYLHDIALREEARAYGMERSDESLATYGAPSGVTSPQASYNTLNMGGWAGTVNKPIGVPNPRALRDWADRSTWVAIAKGKLRRWVERADVAVIPDDEYRPYSKRVQQTVEDLLNQPNEYRDSWRSLVGPVVEDVLVLDRGVIEKNMTLSRYPVSLYYQDGATIKVYPMWSGDPAEPRYLYDPGGATTAQKPLRNDEAIVMIENITSWRLGYSRVQMLQDTIQADIEATQSAIHVVKMKPPPHVIQLPNASERQLAGIRARYDSDFSGRKEVMFMGGPSNMQVHKLVYSLRDQQWMEWNIYLARKIATIFGISPQEFGLTMDINRANAETQADMSENTGYIPLLLLLEEYMNREMVFDFAPRLKGDRANVDALNLRLIFPDVSEIARMLHVEKIITIAKTALAGLPSMTLNMVLAMFGAAPVLGGDTFYAPQTLAPVPWLGYATGGGDLTHPGGELGNQDPAGGLDEANDDDAPAGSDDAGGSGESTSGPASAGGETSTDTPASGTGAEAEKAAPWFSPWYDGRKPGKAWSPASDRRRHGQGKAARVPSYSQLIAVAQELDRIGRKEKTS